MKKRVLYITLALLILVVSALGVVIANGMDGDIPFLQSVLGKSDKELYDVYLNGEFVAVTDKPARVTGVLNSLVQNLSTSGVSYTRIEAELTFTDSTDDRSDDLATITDALSNAIQTYRLGVCLVIDGNPVGYLETRSDWEQVLYEFAQPYVAAVEEGNSYGFDNEITYTTDEIPTEQLLSEDEVKELTAEPDSEVLADADGAFELEDNESILASMLDCYVLDVEITSQVIPRETVISYDDTMNMGDSNITVAGCDGIEKLERTYKYVNGELVGLVSEESTVIREAQTKYMTMGTKFNEADGTGFTWPLPGVTTIVSVYGMRTNPVSGIYKLHSGIDIAGSGCYGKPIVAVQQGTVIHSGWMSGYGNTVTIDHGGGIWTQYAHCSELAVMVGETVAKGQVIAYVGSTGNSTGPHLHFEVYINGTAVDPTPYLEN